MSDLISRQNVIDTIDKYISGFDAIDANFLDGLKTAKKLIKELPSEQPEHTGTHSCDYQRTVTHDWIPVTERLPEEYGEYLVTKRSIGWNCEEYYSVDIAYYDDRFHTANKIVAWMPLPPVYEGGTR